MSACFRVGSILPLAHRRGQCHVATVGGQGFNGNRPLVAGNAHWWCSCRRPCLRSCAIYHWVRRCGPPAQTSGVRSSLSVPHRGLCLFRIGSTLLGYNGAPLGQIIAPPRRRRACKGSPRRGERSRPRRAVRHDRRQSVISVTLHRGPVAATNPYDGLTLEWATTSRPPRFGF